MRAEQAHTLPIEPVKGRPWGVIIAALVGVGVMAYALSVLFGPTDPPRHRSVVKISLVAPPPPPPPPPKPKDEPPPPPKDEVKIDQPQPTPQQPQPSPETPPPGPLGLDAKGTGPGDSFGLAGRPGGRDIMASNGGAGGGLANALFGSNAARQIAQALARDPKLKSKIYRIELLVWISKSGTLEKEQIVRGTEDRELDSSIQSALGDIGALHLAVPDDLPQPMRIRITSSDN